MSGDALQLLLPDGTQAPARGDASGNLLVGGTGTAGTPSSSVQTVQLPNVASATTTSVASATTNTTIVAANSTRQSLSIFNDDANALLIKYGTTASSTSYKVKIQGSGYWERPDSDRYTGIVDGLWEADGSGSARVTET
jgi:hypothetical protein